MKQKTKDPRRSRRLFIVIAILVAAVVLVAAGGYLYSYSQNQLYQESVTQLEELSQQLFEKLEVQIDNQWAYLENLNAALAETGDMTQEELTEQIAHAQKDLGPNGKQLYFRAIDENGHYYTDAGRQGFWTALDKLSGAERQSLIIANWLDNENYMAFAVKTTETLKVDGKKIEYLILLRSMTDMQPFFHSSAFAGRNVAYIIDDDGLVLAQDGSMEGIEFSGKNVFHNMAEQTYPHMDSFDAILAAGNPSGTVCTDVIINNQKYFLVYDRMANYDWVVLLMISAADVAVSTTEMVSSLLYVFITFICVLVVLMVLLLLFLTRIQSDKKILKLQNAARIKLEAAQQETEAALEVAKKATVAKSQFLANMSHDIRTPMNAIMGVMSLMEHEVENPKALRYYIQKLRQSGSYMLGLINDVLDMSKIESGDVQLNVGPVKLAEQVGQIESIIRSQCNEKGQTFTVCVKEIAHEYLIGDSIRLRQIFLNLLTNAVKYTPSGGWVRFEIAEKPCEVPDHAKFFISVIDNGHGMKAEFLKHIFEPFTREVSSVTNKIQGTGLGMSITKSLVDLMGGTIAVESEPEKGSRFDVTLTLPVDTTAEYADNVENVLLISEEDVLVNNVKAALQASPAQLRVASSPEEAVDMLHEKPADAIMLSGVVDAEKLTNTVNLLRRTAKDAVLIFCCDYKHHEHVREALAGTGVNGLIARPFFYENLALAVRAAREEEFKAVKEKSQHSPLNGKRFLCAEDNALNAEILTALLDVHQASCTIYSDGTEIVKAFATVRPGEYDAILMDVQMPNMNGLQATKAIRESENPLGKTIPIIAMTANAFSSDVDECLKAGMDAHLAKPIDMTALERILQSLTSENTVGGGTPVRGEKTHVKQDSV